MEFKLPDIGEGVAEGEVVRWLVKSGDAVREDQPMVEVMTDKATVEITSPITGTVGDILVKEGATVPVGAVLVVLHPGATPASAPARPPASAQSPAPPAPRAPAPAPPQAVSQAVTPHPTPAPPRATSPVAPRAATPPPSAPTPSRTEPAPMAVSAPRAPAPASAVASAPTNGDGPGSRVLATPATRRLARELGVDLGAVTATGPRGRVTREDVQRSAEGASPAAAPVVTVIEHTAPEAAEPATAAPIAVPTKAAARPIPVGEREERVPLRGLRKRIAAQMVKSKFTAPHFSYVEEVDVTELVQLRNEGKPIAVQRGVKLTYLPFIIKALLPAFRQYPYLNAALDEAKDEIVVRRYYNIGIATATPDGLIVPVVKDVDRKSILEIAGEIEQLAAKCRTGKPTLEDLTGGTFTITSAGSIGGLFATPIINHPEVAILGVHKIVRRPVYRGDQIVPRDIMYLSLSLDHRVVDGSVAAEFMNVVVKYLQQPNLLLLEGV